MFRPLFISLCLTSTALATTWTVDDDGKADFDNIQAAVDAAVDGDEIVVMPGAYTGTGDEVVNMLGKEIWLHSSKGEQVTIIDGEGTRRGILCENGETSNTIIEGITITNCYSSLNGGGVYTHASSSLTLTNCTFTDNTADYGGGMYNINNSSPTLTDCTFENNTATFSGGGMYISGGSISLTNCTFTGNTAALYYGGGMYNDISSPTLTNCTITNNTATIGGGMANYNSSPTLTNCTFTGNTAVEEGGGMGNHTWSNPILTDCIFTGNTADYGGGMYNINDSNSTLTNCTFTDNTAAYWGGGMYNHESGPTLIGCIFMGNIAGSAGGGMSNDWTYLSLTNCTFTGNTAPNGGGMANYGFKFWFPTLTDTTVCGNITQYQIYGKWIDNGGNTIADECPPDCPDINGDSNVDVSDLLIVIGYWGSTDSPADINDDGVVDVSDLLIVIGSWGPCE